MKPHWILIANAAGARLFQRTKATDGLALLKSFDHPASRLRTSALGDDPAGRESSDRSFGSAVLAPRLDAHRKEHLHFARELAAALEEGAAHDRCASITIFAGSPFLGELKQELGAGAHRLLAAVHDLDLTHVGVAEISRRIAEQA